jgi:TonB family protein
MKQDIATELFNPAGAARQCTSWQHPLRDLRICVNTETLRTISLRALESLKLNGSSEIGGTLRGNVITDHNGLTIVITDVEFVPSEGRQYNTTPADYQRLVRALRRGPTENGTSLVGYFRSHIRDGLCLSPKDEDLITQHMKDPSDLVLLVRPFEMGMCMAGFFFWENGKLQTTASDFEVPFLALEDPVSAPVEALEPEELLTNGASTKLQSDSSWPQAPASQITAAPTRTRNSEAGPTSKPVIQIPAIAQTANKPSSRRFNASFGSRNFPLSNRLLFGLIAAVTLIVLMGSGLYFGLPALRSYLLAGPTYSRTNQIGLSVLRAIDGQLNISWNRNAPELARAERARITISDGSLYKEVDIDGTQLHLGKLTYFPNSSDVQFRLEVYLDNEHSLAETVRVISPAPKAAGLESISPPDGVIKLAPSAHTATPVALDKPPMGSSERDSRPRRRFNATGLAPLRKPAVPRSIREPPPPEVTLFAAGLNPSHWLLPLNLTSAPPLLLPAEPRIKPSNSISVDTPSEALDRSARTSNAVRSSSESNSATVLHSRPVETVQTNRVPPLQAAPVAPTAGSPGVASNIGTSGAYVPPRPMKKVIPSGILVGPSVIYKVTQVQVQLSIDAQGRVTQAHVVQNANRVNALLAGTAVSAAKQWTFEPATIHGKRIPADHTIVFEFRPHTQ